MSEITLRSAIYKEGKLDKFGQYSHTILDLYIILLVYMNILCFTKTMCVVCLA